MDYSNKILCFGCSHSIGPYDINNNIVDYNGWITYLSNNIKSDKQWVGVSLPGCGIAHYTLLIDKLNQNKCLSNVTDIIIQDTSEIRLTYKIYEYGYGLDKFVYEISKSLKSENHIERNILPGFGVNLFSKDIIDREELKLLNSPDSSRKMSENISLIMDEYTENLWKHGLIDILLTGMKTHIQKICNDNNIKFHNISWKENITGLIKKYNLHDNGYGHWDKTTVDMMNKMFYNELKNELE